MSRFAQAPVSPVPLDQDDVPMGFVPSSGLAYTSPARTPASLFRSLYPERVWRFNPWMGCPRAPSDIEADPFGLSLQQEASIVWAQT